MLSGNVQVFGSIRDKYGDLEDDESLVNFFNEVLSLRDIIDEENKASSVRASANQREE